MYFCSERIGNIGNEDEEDIWVAKRKSKQDSWEAPTNLGATINSSSREFMPFLSPDSLELYFTSDREGGYGRCDLYVIERDTIERSWSEPKNLGPVINSQSEESDPTISADGLVLYFSSIRKSGYGGSDIWFSKRATRQDVWGPPVNLGPVINTSSQEVMPYISNNDLVLLFSSDPVLWIFNKQILYRTFSRARLFILDKFRRSDCDAYPISIGNEDLKIL